MKHNKSVEFLSNLQVKPHLDFLVMVLRQQSIDVDVKKRCQDWLFQMPFFQAL